jgi:two-component system alkaline phosphatase synthesis response regulator PhoP
MGKKKIIVIDDEVDFLKIVTLNLEGTGKYEVLALSTAKDIMPQIHEFRPDIIILDILMPGVGGIEVCQMLNNDSIGRNIPIIVLSALEKDEDKKRAYKVGVVDYIVKPVEIKSLIARIEKALRFK